MKRTGHEKEFQKERERKEREQDNNKYNTMHWRFTAHAGGKSNRNKQREGRKEKETQNLVIKKAKKGVHKQEYENEIGSGNSKASRQ